MENIIDIFCHGNFIVDRKSIRQTIEKTLRELKVSTKVELSVSIVTEERMKELHQKYMGSDKVTDVLSFPTEESPHIGDIVICYPEAIRRGETMEFLVDHGLRHLLGYHHE